MIFVTGLSGTTSFLKMLGSLYDTYGIYAKGSFRYRNGHDKHKKKTYLRPGHCCKSEGPNVIT